MKTKALAEFEGIKECWDNLDSAGKERDALKSVAAVFGIANSPKAMSVEVTEWVLSIVKTLISKDKPILAYSCAQKAYRLSKKSKFCAGIRCLSAFQCICQTAKAISLWKRNKYWGACDSFLEALHYSNEAGDHVNGLFSWCYGHSYRYRVDTFFMGLAASDSIEDGIEHCKRFEECCDWLINKSDYDWPWLPDDWIGIGDAIRIFRAKLLGRSVFAVDWTKMRKHFLQLAMDFRTLPRDRLPKSILKYEVANKRSSNTGVLKPLRVSCLRRWKSRVSEPKECIVPRKRINVIIARMLSDLGRLQSIHSGKQGFAEGTRAWPRAIVSGSDGGLEFDLSGCKSRKLKVWTLEICGKRLHLDAAKRQMCKADLIVVRNGENVQILFNRINWKLPTSQTVFRIIEHAMKNRGVAGDIYELMSVSYGGSWIRRLIDEMRRNKVLLREGLDPDKEALLQKKIITCEAKLDAMENSLKSCISRVLNCYLKPIRTTVSVPMKVSRRAKARARYRFNPSINFCFVEC